MTRQRIKFSLSLSPDEMAVIGTEGEEVLKKLIIFELKA